ncbi:MAG: N-acetylmuramoyl-L-alanine amidase [Alphaproteobacteria bacterium]|nr:N-acetylmuramoyl-L-alanine amidase [Alphaproteobacteria bacterium]
MNFIPCPSPNFDDRAGGQSPSMIILHYTGTITAEEARERFCNESPTDSVGRISPHYLIDGYGGIYKFVEEDKRAWHAGHASWEGVTDINSASIGIEIWNTGHEFDYEEFRPLQIESVIGLIKDIRTRWNISHHNILGHSDVAPGRKLDPGEKFPWTKLAQAGIGVMPDIHYSASFEIDDFYAALKEYGYTYTNDQDILLKEFRRHFLPHLLNHKCLTNEDIDAIGFLSQIKPKIGLPSPETQKIR